MTSVTLNKNPSDVQIPKDKDEIIRLLKVFNVEKISKSKTPLRASPWKHFFGAGPYKLKCYFSVLGFREFETVIIWSHLGKYFIILKSYMVP